jgi:hypothetical protein
MPYIQVTRYQTSDGKLHHSKLSAREHGADLARQMIEDKLKHLTHDDLALVQVYRVVMALIPDPDGLKELAKEIHKIAFPG